MAGPIFANQRCNVPPQAADMGTYKDSGSGDGDSGGSDSGGDSGGGHHHHGHQGNSDSGDGGGDH